MLSSPCQIDKVLPKRKDRVADCHVADQTNRVHRDDTTARKSIVREYIGFQLEEKKKNEPTKFVQCGGEVTGPVVPTPSGVEGVLRLLDIVADVVGKVDEQ